MASYGEPARESSLKTVWKRFCHFLKIFIYLFQSVRGIRVVLSELLYLTQKVSGEDDDDDGRKPSWEKQEAMVRKLQRKFPDQDKEVKTQTLCLAL